MINSFFGLEMGRRAMDYFRRGMETAGHNIANADVEGYSRQRVEASTTEPYTVPGMSRPEIPLQIGTGVKVDAIVRLRDAFLDAQYREEASLQGYWEALEQAINNIELFVNEPAGEGLSSALNAFWSALEELQKRPENSAAREGVIQSAQSLTVFLSQLARNYDQYRVSLNNDLKLSVEEANSLIDQIAALNGTIAEIQAVGGNPNDLLDRRDLLVDKLSLLLDVSVASTTDQADGDFKIDLHGKTLVQGTQSRHLVLVSMAGNEGYYDVQVEDNLFDQVSDPSVLLAIVEQRAAEAVHSVRVNRLATETAWKVGSTGGLSNVTSPDQALNLRGSFGLQVSSGGVIKNSISFADSGGRVLGTPGPGEPTEYSFRLAAGGFESVVTVKWNSTDNRWDISDNLGNTNSAGSDLYLADLEGFVNNHYSSDLNASVDSSRLVLESVDHNLISMTDIKGDLASKMGLADAGKTVTIDVVEEDTLQTIANKINSAYAAASGSPSAPEEWLNASVKESIYGSYYLELESHVVGEAYRINVLGDEGGSFYAAQNLGLTDGSGRTNVIEAAEDALFLFDGREYLSSSNAFKDARRITPDDGYAASTLEEVSPGVRLTLQSTGDTSITVLHHVKGGKILGLLEARDDIILSHLDSFDELAYRLALEFNAIHRAGHGIGDNAELTGISFFKPLPSLAGAAEGLSVNSALVEDSSLIAAASGDGTGHSVGSGDGSNALRMAQLKQSKVLKGRSASFNEFYESFIATLGAQGQRARTMADNQRALMNQINAQRQSVMGVNIDEEMMDIIKFQQAFNAMARYITTIDEMLDVIVNRMGIVGR
ncbi:flagellar hook-associated protein FlgK [Acetomicrobium sp. S15 = DSM 107314]|uniref:flagellar hook-associated protein FlgK n=1 Tax=Acetomicrobium sp. S15 = DSM 107314 TaxID=2529858 RepID=UPI0018E11EF9|nr:flagellar hook-associated protein FlgK [Acetomicrobium sp. S15 = DSM 107314]